MGNSLACPKQDALKETGSLNFEHSLMYFEGSKFKERKIAKRKNKSKFKERKIAKRKNKPVELLSFGSIREHNLSKLCTIHFSILLQYAISKNCHHSSPAPSIFP
jgi:hypothetical protein